jgi:hypothetical protein
MTIVHFSGKRQSKSGEGTRGERHRSEGSLEQAFVDGRQDRPTALLPLSRKS